VEIFFLEKRVAEYFGLRNADLELLPATYSENNWVWQFFLSTAKERKKFYSGITEHSKQDFLTRPKIQLLKEIILYDV